MYKLTNKTINVFINKSINGLTNIQTYINE